MLRCPNKLQAQTLFVEYWKIYHRKDGGHQIMYTENHSIIGYIDYLGW